MEYFVSYWLPVVVMLCFMFYSSTDEFSPGRTYSVLETVVRWIFPHASAFRIDQLNFLLRKLGHVVGYTLLALLLFRAFRGASLERWRASWAWYSMTTLVLLSVLDELHQSFTETRHPSPFDSLLDITGGVLALAGLALYYRRLSAGAQHKKHNK